MLDWYLLQLRSLLFLPTKSIHFDLWESDRTGLVIWLMPHRRGTSYQASLRTLEELKFFPYKLFSWIETLYLWKMYVEVKRNFMAKCVPPLGPGTYLVSGNSIMSLAKSTCFAQSMHWYRQTSFQNTHSLPAQAIPMHYLPQPGLRYCGFATNDSWTVSMTQVSLPSFFWASLLSFIWQWYVHM